MFTDYEAAFRHLLKSIIREVALELSIQNRLPDPPDSNRYLQSNDNFLLTSREAAKRIAISDRHLFGLTLSGVLPCVRVGKSVRYSIATIQEWIRQSESTGSTAETGIKIECQELPSKAHAVATSHRNASKSRLVPNVGTRQEKVKSKMQRKKARTTITVRQTTEEPEERRNPFTELLEEIGVKRSDIPEQTNGDLRRIAEVDVPTYHGWMYHNRELPQEAFDKLKVHFQAYRKADDSVAGGNR